MIDRAAPPLTIDAFDPARHDRQDFSCGIAQVDNFFRMTAAKLSRADNLRTFVMVDARGRTIGFYALNAHAIDYADLPPRFARTRPRHGTIPAAYISMIGVNHRCQAQGFGGVLLADALRRLAGAATALGIAVVIMDVLDCGDASQVERRLALYLAYGFRSLPSRPLRLFLPMATVRTLLDAS